VPKIRALFESTFFAGLRKAGMSDTDKSPRPRTREPQGMAKPG